MARDASSSSSSESESESSSDESEVGGRGAGAARGVAQGTVRGATQDGSSDSNAPGSLSSGSSDDAGDAMSEDDISSDASTSDSSDASDDEAGDAGKGKKEPPRDVAREAAAARLRQGLPVAPLVQASGVELAQLLKKLNADGEEQLEALNLFAERARLAIEQRGIGGGEGADLIHAYFKGSPECAELFRVLAKGAARGDKMRDSGKMNALMRLLQALLACHVVPLLLEHSRDLGTRLIRKSNKAIVSAISSGKTRLFAEAMRVICRASELGVVQARDAWKKFSPYMKNMARHFEVMKTEDKTNKEGPRVERPFAREARGAVIEWGIVLLRVADPQLMAPVLGTNTFLPAAIKHLASDPPELVDQLLQVILDRVLSSRELSFPIRAALFSGFNLQVLAGVLRATDPSHSGGWASSPGTCDPKIVAAVRLKVIKVLQTFTCDVLSSTTERAGAANVKLLLPLVTALRPSDDEQQQQLLMAVLTRHPTLQSHYLVASPLPLAPAASHKFLTSAAVMSKVLALIPGNDTQGSLLHALHILPPHQERAFLQQEAAGVVAGGLASIGTPPARTAALLADWVAPPLLCKSSLR